MNTPTSLKAEGNAHHAAGAHDLAVAAYSQALALVDESTDEEDGLPGELPRLQLRATLLANRAAAHLAAGASLCAASLTRCIADCDACLALGLVDGNVDWLSSIWLARLTLIVADVWQWTPFLFIIFVAALQGQDQEIEEAARLDGASWPAIFWNISLPMMRPIIVVAITLRGIDITTMFTNVYIMTQGSPGGATETMSFFIYRQGFRMFNFGYASAASVLMLALTLVIAQTVVKRAFRSGRS